MLGEASLYIMLKYVFINSVLSVYNKNGWSEQTKIIVVVFWGEGDNCFLLEGPRGGGATLH